MSRPLGSGITVNAKRPHAGVKSQLHTPLTSKPHGEDAAGSMSGVKRESTDRNPLLSAQGVVAPLSGTSLNSDSTKKSPVDTLLQEFLTRCRVAPLNSYVPETVDGLRQVAEAGDWRSVVDKSGKMVAEADFEATGNDSLSASLQLRFEGLFRMKLFDDLSFEISKVLGSEVKYMEATVADISEKKQAPAVYKIVSLSVLLCEIKSLTGRGAEALEQLYKLRTNLGMMANDSTISSDSITIQWWQMKIWNQIINVLLRQRQWHLALHELSQLLLETRQLRDQLSAEKVGASRDHVCSHESIALRAEVVVLCRISRLLLQIGSVLEAAKYWEEAKGLVSDKGVLDTACMNHIGITEGLLLHTKNEYDSAVVAFENVRSRILAALTGDAANIGESWTDSTSVLFARPPTSNKTIKVAFANSLIWHVTGGTIAYEGNIHAAAVNNMASSLLYLRRIKESISLLEDLIQADPVRNMTDPVVFNLTTMYDLSCAHDLSGFKKKVLQSVAAIYHVYDLSYKSFRL